MRIEGNKFKDNSGRTLMLRGVNLGGSSKVPVRPDGATYLSEGFYQHREVSFVGRPFPLQEAEEHFSRLKSWGFNFLRFLVTWEAIEHSGPGEYDQEYLEYIRAVVEKAAEFGIQMFIDPHQDVWSRFSGGDGAPGWTLEAAGFEISNFQETAAAFTHQAQGDPLPKMIWSTNATKLAAATMFSLFFGGSDFAPRTKIEGESAQEFLQRHYIQSIVQLARVLIDLPNVVGYDSMNEPLEGWIGVKDLNKRYTTIEKGFIPTPFQAMQLGAGLSLKLDKWERGILGPRVIGNEVINPSGIRAWRDGFDPIWQVNGVWRTENSKSVLLRPDHFSTLQGNPINFNRHYYVPFNNRFADAIRKIQPKSMIFVEKSFDPQGPSWGPEDARHIVYAPHWYDPIVLVMKRYLSWLNYDQVLNKLVLGSRNIQRSFREQLARPLQHAKQKMGNPPVLIGEVGIAFDLDRKKAYQDQNFSSQIKANDRIMVALEENLHHFTLWNYTADNTNQRGDLWNDEDLSIFSRDQQKDQADLNSGGRALEAVIRPYPLAVAGEIIRVAFDIRKVRFELEFRHDPKIQAPTLVYVPGFHYSDRMQVEISAGEYEYDAQEQLLAFRPDPSVSRHKLILTVKQKN